jgi:hypothetical protein
VNEEEEEVDEEAEESWRSLPAADGITRAPRVAARCDLLAAKLPHSDVTLSVRLHSRLFPTPRFLASRLDPSLHHCYAIPCPRRRSLLHPHNNRSACSLSL